jgi:hypothetical protein
MKRKVPIAILILWGLAASALIAAQIIGYLDMSLMSAPGNPAIGFARIWADTSSSKMKCKLSGSSCFFDSSGVTLQTNGTPNGSQTLLNLKGGTNMTLTDNGSGQITFDASGGGSSITLQTNGVNNGSQSTLNLAAGSGITLADNGTGP